MLPLACLRRCELGPLAAELDRGGAEQAIQRPRTVEQLEVIRAPNQLAPDENPRVCELRIVPAQGLPERRDNRCGWGMPWVSGRAEELYRSRGTMVHGPAPTSASVTHGRTGAAHLYLSVSELDDRGVASTTKGRMFTHRKILLRARLGILDVNSHRCDTGPD